VKVATILPAYNEEKRIGKVLEAVRAVRTIDEIIVVSDGSTDRTVEVAKTFEGVTVISLPKNVGKGGAMAAGLRHTDADIILFLDADLIGLQPHHVEALIEPVMNGCEMSIGVFRKGKFWTDTAHKIAPFISGQRALRRYLLDQIPWLEECRMGAEVTINQTAKSKNVRVKRVPLIGVSHPPKEKKFGLVKGTAARAKMYAEMGKAYVKTRRRLRTHK